MSDEKKALERFTQKAEGTEVTFVPQCNNCELNIAISQCQEFNEKPYAYRKNQEACPKKVPRKTS